MKNKTSKGIPYELIAGTETAERILKLEHTAHCFKAYEVNPSYGCDFLCRYCSMYSQEKTEQHIPVKLYRDYPKYLKLFIENRDDKNKLLFYFSAKADVFSPVYIESGITEEIIDVFKETNVRFFIITKGATITESIFNKLIETKNKSQLIISFGLPNKEMEQKLEPGAPSSKIRLEFAKRCIENGINVTGLVAPYLPFDNSDLYAKEVFTKFKEVGINHIGLQPLKLSSESLERLGVILPDKKERLDFLFDKKSKMLKGWKLPGGRRIDRYYTNLDYLTKELHKLKIVADNLDLTISTCVEICKLTIPKFNNTAYKAGYNCAGLSKNLFKNNYDNNK